MVMAETIKYDFESPIPLRHYVALDNRKYKKQSDIHMGKVTNDFKRIGCARLHSITDIVEKLASGHCGILANYEIDSDNNFRFVSSSLIALDVDDDDAVTNPIQVLEQLKGICVGLFYTFSHGIKGNRYRLLIALDQSITDADEYRMLVNYLSDYLKDLGLPVDGHTGIRNPTSVIRPGNNGYELNDLSTTLNVAEWLPKAKEKHKEHLKQLEEKRKSHEKQLNYDLLNPVTYDELKQMCEAIGYIPSGHGDDETNKWLQIVYAIKNEVYNGEIDEFQGFELYSIVSGPETNQRYWDSVKPYGHVTVGTIIHHATNAGYRRKHKYGYALQETTENIKVERMKVKDYLTPDIAKQLIERKQKIIVDSPTGSRKTSSFMQAFKELASHENHYFIFSAPTIPLTEQVAESYGGFCVKGDVKNLVREAVKKAASGERIFVATYDKTAELMQCLQRQDRQSKFTVVVDEVHKFTEAYNYRFAAIDQLEQVAEIAQSLIGLSGTTTDMLKDNFEALIKIDTGNTKSPCLDFRVFTYHTRNARTQENNAHLADVMLIPVIKALLKQTRVLVFLNNKERIERIARLLKKDGIAVQQITSDSKKSSTYTQIVKNSKVDDDVQVILSTSVIAEGVSIDNELDFSCLVVADRASPIFNISTVKQISNRMRKQYRYFCLYMREPNENFNETKPFHIETDFRYRKRIVEGYVNYLNEEFKGEAIQEFTALKVEKANGIFYRSTNANENSLIEYNPLFVRHQSMKRKESYYSTFRNAFIKDIERQIGVPCTAIVNVNDEALRHGESMDGLLQELEAEQEQKKLDDNELRAAFSQCFDESHYGCFVRGDEEALKFFKENIHPSQYRSMLRVCPITDYETAKMIGNSIKKDADTHKYFNDIQSLVEIALLEATPKTNVTKKIYKELIKLSGENFTSVEFKELAKFKMPKKLKVTDDDVSKALKFFHKESSRPGGVSCTSIQPLTIELLSEVRYSVDEQVIKNSVLKYSLSQAENKRKKMLLAINSKYGITCG